MSLKSDQNRYAELRQAKLSAFWQLRNMLRTDTAADGTELTAEHRLEITLLAQRLRDELKLLTPTMPKQTTVTKHLPAVPIAKTRRADILCACGHTLASHRTGKNTGRVICIGSPVTDQCECEAFQMQPKAFAPTEREQD